MLVLNKKRIILVAICLCISVFAFMLNSSKEEQETQETVVLPVSRQNYNNRCRTWSSR